MARGVRARELLITTANSSLSQKEKKTLRSLSLSLSCVFFFLPSLANTNTLEEKENARKSDRLL